MRLDDNSRMQSVVIMGASGTMGAGAAVVFAGAEFHVTMLARQLERAKKGLETAKNAARAEALVERVEIGALDDDLERTVANADLVFEALAEDLELKRRFFERVDGARRPDTVVATNSLGLSVAAMAQGRSESFRRHFLGLHMYNPPHLIVGTEVIPNPDTDPAVTEAVVRLLSKRLGRKVIVTRDRPAFVGNRVGFKVLNEIAQLVPGHGVAFLDYLIGPHTGRSMPPLRTIDLVGWDIHKAVVDNVYANCPEDEARAAFNLPAYMAKGIAEGRLGDKTREAGGFYRREGKQVYVLDATNQVYKPYEAPPRIDFVERMRSLNHVGRYREAMTVMAEARGVEADLMRRIILGYVGYALNRVGDVALSTADVDSIMSYGFSWAPPGAIVDLLGAENTVKMLGRYGLAVLAAVEEAAAKGTRLFTGGVLEYGRTFVG